MKHITFFYLASHFDVLYNGIAAQSDTFSSHKKSPARASPNDRANRRHRERLRTVADGCGRLRTVANGCERLRSLKPTSANTPPTPRPPTYKREPFATHSGKKNASRFALVVLLPFSSVMPLPERRNHGEVDLTPSKSNVEAMEIPWCFLKINWILVMFQDDVSTKCCFFNMNKLSMKKARPT